VSLDEAKGENDIVVESKGVNIVYEKDFEDYLEEAVVSYSDSGFNAGFKVNGASMSKC
jgi:Fe-S cluster assembly iron-binding protein IscA